jgi:hypothetical protein
VLDSDDAVTTDLLGGLLELLADSAGWLHPGARLVARAGQLSVHASAEPDELLVRVPAALLIRVGRVDWSVNDGVLTPAAISPEIVGLELEALFVLIGLLNQTAKIPDLLATHPLLADDLPPRVVEAVSALRPSFGSARPDPVSLLWSTRCFRKSFDGSAPEPIAVPILELMNHHSRGARAEPAAGGFAAHAQVLHSDECFLDYGRARDAISMAVVYGFADASAQCAHSAPLQIDVPGVGLVVVSAHGRDEYGELLPMSVLMENSQLHISRMTFGNSFAPVNELMSAGGLDVSVARKIVDSIQEANIVLLEGVSSATSEAPAALTLRKAAEIQRLLIVNSPVEGDFIANSTHSTAKRQISEDHFDLGQWRRINDY